MIPEADMRGVGPTAKYISLRVDFLLVKTVISTCLES